MTKNLIFVFGDAGVGKTTACFHLQKLLPSNIFLDADCLHMVHPFVSTEKIMEVFYKNLVYILNNYISTQEQENIIVTYIVPKKEEILQEILSQLNLNDSKLHFFILACSEQEHSKRVNRDASPRGRVVGKTKGVDRIKTYKQIKYEIIDTTNLTAKEVAHQIATKI